MTSPQKVAMVAAVPMTLKVFMAPLLAALTKNYSVTAICNASPEELAAILPKEVDCQSVNLERKISPWKDFLAFFQLLRIFRAGRFSLVHSITPKAGLIAMAAAFVSRIPVRMHVFTGQVWANRVGVVRWLLKSFDRLIVMFATHVVADSASQRQFLIDEGVVQPERISVLGCGSISGVDVQRFSPSPETRIKVRDELKIPSDAVFVLYLGRLNREKGILDLAQAFAQTAKDCPSLYFVVVGPDEEQLVDVLSRMLEPCADRVRFIGMTPHPEHYMAAADIFCLASYREGFGSVTIEAAATGVPALASRIYGITDAVVEGLNGLLHPVGSVAEIASGMNRLASDASFRKSLGQAAYERALRDFSSPSVVRAWLDYYSKALVGDRNRYN